MSRDASAISGLSGGREVAHPSPVTPGEVEVRILDAAAELVAAVGLHATIDTVAKRAGVGRATIYRYFDSKDAVLGAMARREVFEVFTEIAARTAEESDARAKAIALYAATFEAAVMNPIIRRIALDDPKALLELRKVCEPVDLEATILDALKGALDDVRLQVGRVSAEARTEMIAQAFINTINGYIFTDADPPPNVASLAAMIAEMSVEAGLAAES